MIEPSQDRPMKPYKERVEESVYLLKQVQELGIKPSHAGYSILKQHLDEWVKEDKEWSGDIDFPMHYRRGILTLSMSPNTVAKFHLKHFVFDE